MTEPTQVERRVSRDYRRDFLPALAGYLVALAVVVALVDFDTAGSWKYLAALTPVIPALWGTRAITRHLDRIDEMQREIQVDGMAAGFALAMVTAITVGFLAMAGLDANRWGPWAIYGIGMLGWLLTSTRAARTR